MMTHSRGTILKDSLRPPSDVAVPQCCHRESGAVRAHAAAPLEISFCPHSVGWSTHHKQFIAVGTAGGVHTLPNGTAFHGRAMVVLALSDDLLHWGETHLLKPCEEDISLHMRESYPSRRRDCRTLTTLAATRDICTTCTV